MFSLGWHRDKREVKTKHHKRNFTQNQKADAEQYSCETFDNEATAHGDAWTRIGDVEGLA